MVHTGSICLPATIKLRCVALINVGKLAGLIRTAEDAHRANTVYLRLIFDSLLIHDLLDLQRLANGLNESGAPNESLTEDISELSAVLDLFIQAASTPTRPCGIWSAVMY